MSNKNKSIIVILLGLLIMVILYFYAIYPARYAEEPTTSENLPTQANVNSNTLLGKTNSVFTLTDGVWLHDPKPMPTFNYTDDTGKAFTQDNLKGHWTLLFFGFANCEHVCPTTLSTLRQVYQQLEKKLPSEKLPHIVMVSVDPARDTFEAMHSYVKSFNENFTGIRADEAQRSALEKPLNIFAIKIPAKDNVSEHYMIEHTPDLMIIDPEGRLRGSFNYPEKAEILVKDYLEIVNNVKN